MHWESLGFKSDPLSTDPINQTTLHLYTGHKQEVAKCQNVLSQKNVLIVIEGNRGVGTTSFANFLRFSAQKNQSYFTPRNEIRVEANWRLETLLSVIIANIVRELDLFHPQKVEKDKRFLNAKTLSTQIAEAYRSFGVEAFGFGINYGKSAGINSQPTVVSSAVLGHHLEDLSELIQSLGYRYGTLIQLNNLDIGTIHEEKHIQYLFNALRDYIQTDGISWMLVGDIGLRRYIAQEVDRLDDIVNFETVINPLVKAEYGSLLDKRVTFYQSNAKAVLPIEQEVFNYLYKITKGRLRYIFSLIQRLMNELLVGDLTDKITIEIAKPMVIKFARERVTRNNLAKGEEQLLKELVKSGSSTVTALEKKMKKSKQYISKMLINFAKLKLATVKKDGKNRYYTPVLDAIIAYAVD